MSTPIMWPTPQNPIIPTPNGGGNYTGPAGGGSGGPTQGPAPGNTNGGIIVLDPGAPGDLGTPQLTLQMYQLVQQSDRINAALNEITVVNNRYRGHRESKKFLLLIQQFLNQCVGMLIQIRGYWWPLGSVEQSTLYPSSNDIAAYYYCNEQLRFREWLYFKDINTRWYV